MAIELQVAENAPNHFARVTEPHFIFCELPLRWAVGYGWQFLVTQGKTFPGDTSEWDGVNLS